jgi:hypothetical protein
MTCGARANTNSTAGTSRSSPIRAGIRSGSAASKPGSAHDITTPRRYALPALYPATAAGLPTLTDKGYTGAGIGIQVPLKATTTFPPTTALATPSSPPRAPAERANALLKGTWRALRRSHLDLWRIGAVTAALVILHLQNPAR